MENGKWIVRCLLSGSGEYIFKCNVCAFIKTVSFCFV